MGVIEIFLIGIGLSMDAFAVSICKGLSMPRLNAKQMIVIGLFFGGFQALMPLVGWALGTSFESLITPIDHWIAFILLGFLGAKMIIDGVRSPGGCQGEACAIDTTDTQKPATQKLDLKELLLMAIATSIDALAVGITFAFLGVSILQAILVIGVTTGILSMLGVIVGHFFGARFEKPATICGGVVLILIGLKILLEHLGILAI